MCIESFCTIQKNVNYFFICGKLRMFLWFQNLKVVLNESLVLGMTSVLVYLRTHTTTFGNSDDSDNDFD